MTDNLVCKGKIPYVTRDEATKAIIGFNKVGHQSMKSYYCNQCDAWHIFTEGKKKNRDHKMVSIVKDISDLKIDEDKVKERLKEGKIYIKNLCQ